MKNPTNSTKDSGYMVRSLVGGLEILVKLLKSDNINVLAAVCGTVVKVVQDEESIGILTELKVCPLLAKALCAVNINFLNLKFKLGKRYFLDLFLNISNFLYFTK